MSKIFAGMLVMAGPAPVSSQQTDAPGWPAKISPGRNTPVLPTILAALILDLTAGPVEAHGGSVPAMPTGLTAVGFHGDIGLHHEITTPHVMLSWAVA